ncbi:hypothetical protein B0H13DRAFT_2037242, partial [Mycena leptocephala]
SVIWRSSSLLAASACMAEGLGRYSRNRCRAHAVHRHGATSSRARPLPLLPLLEVPTTPLSPRRPRDTMSSRKKRSSKLYVRTTGEKDCAECPQHISRTDAESAWGGRPRSLEWAYAEADSEMTAVWVWSGVAGRYPQARDEGSCPSQL